MRRDVALGLVVCLAWGLAGCQTEMTGGARAPTSLAASDGGPDGLTTMPGPGGGAEWDCPFPPEADKAKIDHAVVTMIVRVAADGTPKECKLVVDPGYGFGAAAAKCAMAREFTPAQDAQGNPIEGMTPPIRVHFER